MVGAGHLAIFELRLGDRCPEIDVPRCRRLDLIGQLPRRPRPMMDGMDVKVVIAETELFSIHQKDLIDAARRLRPRFPRARAAGVPLPGRRLRAGAARAPPLHGGDEAALREIRRAADLRIRAGAAPRRPPHGQLLAALQHFHAFERRAHPGARRVQRLFEDGAAARACRSSAGRSTTRAC